MFTKDEVKRMIEEAKSHPHLVEDPTATIATFMGEPFNHRSLDDEELQRLTDALNGAKTKPAPMTATKAAMLQKDSFLNDWPHPNTQHEEYFPRDELITIIAANRSHADDLKRRYALPKTQIITNAQDTRGKDLSKNIWVHPEFWMAGDTASQLARKVQSRHAGLDLETLRRIPPKHTTRPHLIGPTNKRPKEVTLSFSDGHLPEAVVYQDQLLTMPIHGRLTIITPADGNQGFTRPTPGTQAILRITRNDGFSFTETLRTNDVIQVPNLIVLELGYPEPETEEELLNIDEELQ